ncbi:MAG: regulatory protein RecX [Nitrospinae bacterium]|nr:regulatory protein RecX [Nitrospinota bacterium]
MPLQEESKKARKAALKYLVYRDRSRNEISRHLMEKEFSASAVEETLVYLEGNRYVDDTRFALQFGQSRIVNKRVGKIRLRRELKDKGLDNALIDQTLDSLYAEHDESKVALACAQKKIATLGTAETEKKRARLARFLERKGFSISMIYPILDQLIPHSPGNEAVASCDQD